MAKLILRIWLSCLVVYCTLPGSGSQDSAPNFSRASEAVLLEAPSTSHLHNFISVDSIVLVEFEEDSDSRTKSTYFGLTSGDRSENHAILADDAFHPGKADQIQLTIDRVIWLDRFLI